MAKIKFGRKAKRVGDKAAVPAPSVPLWMQTYSDFVTLLLTFFVMLLATLSDSVNDSKIQLIATAFKGAFGSMPGGSTLQESKLIYAGATIQTLPSTESGSSVARKVKEASFILQAEVKSKKVRVSEDERGFVISIGADRFFKPGSDEIENTQETIETFIRIASLLEGLPNEIRIEGHTDSGMIAPGSLVDIQFGSNWGLSSARAIAVMRKIFEEDQNGVLDRNKYSITGYADTRPIASNDTPEGKALNRRVDIIVIRNDVNYYNQK